MGSCRGEGPAASTGWARPQELCQNPNLHQAEEEKDKSQISLSRKVEADQAFKQRSNASHLKRGPTRDIQRPPETAIRAWPNSVPDLSLYLSGTDRKYNPSLTEITLSPL